MHRLMRRLASVFASRLCYNRYQRRAAKTKTSICEDAGEPVHQRGFIRALNISTQRAWPYTFPEKEYGVVLKY